MLSELSKLLVEHAIEHVKHIINENEGESFIPFFLSIDNNGIIVPGSNMFDKFDPKTFVIDLKNSINKSDFLKSFPALVVVSEAVSDSSEYRIIRINYDSEFEEPIDVYVKFTFSNEFVLIGYFVSKGTMKLNRN